mgnify:CR=1 FL=1
MVITADIPLADKGVSKSALDINPRGELYSLESIREKLFIRYFLAEMRDAGEITGGPKRFSDE